MKTSRAPAPIGSEIDPVLFPPAFLRLLAVVPRAVERLRTGVAEGRRASPGEGGRYLFRGHRAYRPGDDPRRVDWKVAARLGRLLVRQFDAERDALTEVWLDGSASMAPLGGRVASARAAAIACAVGLASEGRARLGIVADGHADLLLEADRPGRLRAFLGALSARAPGGRADLAQALPRLVRRVPWGARLLFVSDLLSRADPGVLHTLAGRGLRGAVLHLRLPEVYAPEPTEGVTVRDAETGEERALALDRAGAARVAAAAARHGDRWARHAAAVGLLYLPFAPSTPEEVLLRRLVEEVP